MDGKEDENKDSLPHCEWCEGDGYSVEPEACKHCNGTGVVEE